MNPFCLLQRNILSPETYYEMNPFCFTRFDRFKESAGVFPRVLLLRIRRKIGVRGKPATAELLKKFALFVVRISPETAIAFDRQNTGRRHPRRTRMNSECRYTPRFCFPQIVIFRSDSGRRSPQFMRRTETKSSYSCEK